jgi:type II secretory pathway predicted ATPase ExeA
MSNTRNAPHLAIRLKTVLREHGISQEELAECIRQPSGKLLSRVAINVLLNRGVWPVTTTEADIRRVTETMLRERQVGEEEIATIWEREDHDRPHGQPQHYRTGGASYGPRNHSHHPEVPDSEIREMIHPSTHKHFGLFRDPFQNDVLSSDDVFLPINYREMREAMLWAARNGNLFAGVGDSGAGKTVLMRDVIESIQADSDQQIVVIQPTIIDKTRLTASMITEAIIYDLMPDAKIRRTAEGKERQAQSLLRDSHKAGKRHVLVIEEAHDLSIHTLKLLKRFWEIVEGHRHLLGIILVGQPELQSKLDNYKHEARELINRLEIATLEPLGRELEAYLAMKFQRINKPMADILAPDACDALRTKLRRQVGNGLVSLLYPLHVNVEITRAMNKAADLGAPLVDAAIIAKL